MKKRILGGLLATCTMASLLAGCAGGEASTTEYLGTYDTEVTSLVPYYLPDTSGKKVIANTIDGLIETDSTGKYVPALAESWTHNDDYTVWTFTLRQGANWYDSEGEVVREVVAQDFVDGMRFVADHANTKSDISIVRNEIEGLADYYWNLVDFDDPEVTEKPADTREEIEASFDETVGVKALDTYTVEYTLTQPTPYFESYLLTELFLPNNKEFSDSLGEKFGTTEDNLLYCGAYYLNKWQRNKEFVMIKNEEYYDADKITVDTIILQSVGDASTVEMFKRGELTSTSIDGSQVEFYMNDEEWGEYVNLADKSSVNYWFSINFVSPNSEFDVFSDNLDFRKALYHALDRETFAELFNPYGAEEMLINTVTPNEVCLDENGKDYTEYEPLKSIKDEGSATYDPTLAKEYFDKAVLALTDGNGNITGATATEVDFGRQNPITTDAKLPLQIVYVHETETDDVALAQLVKLNIEEVFGKENVEVVLSPITGEKYNDVIAPGYYDLSYDSFSFKFADPVSQLERLVTDGAVNDGKYSDATFDALVEEASSLLTPSERYAKFAEAEAHLIENVYVIPWESGGGVYEMSRAVPFTAPRGGFGIVRFKYKGIELQAEPVSQIQYEEAYNALMEEINN